MAMGTGSAASGDRSVAMAYGALTAAFVYAGHPNNLVRIGIAVEF